MVLLKVKCPPELRKATIAVRLSTSSPTCFVDPNEEGSDHPFQIVLSLRIKFSTQPGRAITILTRHSVFEQSEPGAGFDILSRNTFTALTSTTDSSRSIHLGNLMPHYVWSSQAKPLDLKERYGGEGELLTIPADGTEVQIRHDMPISRILLREPSWSRDDLRSGESFRFRMNPAYLVTSWWCWGDLEGELKGKKLSQWQSGINPSRAERPSEEKLESGEWVVGERLAGLAFEDEGGEVEFRIQGVEESKQSEVGDLDRSVV